VRGQQVDELRADLAQLPSRYSIRTSRDAASIASQAARIARQRIGLNETATLMEFTAAAAGGLDHYSAFLTADQLRDIYSQIEGNFVGLGVELKADNGALLIIDVIPRSPAEQAGIRDGDRITAVDGRATASLSTDEAASLLTGAEGSLVRVTVVTPGQPARDLSVRRASVEVPSLEDVKILDPASGVAPGGLLTASVEVADKFIADGGIVSTRGRSEQENFSYRAHRPGTWRVPLVVLIDGDSASASEIFAGAIQDAGRGKIVGSRSYGKGSVQGIFPLGKSGAGARLTTARFFSPLGHPISNVGITPDVDARRAPMVAGGEQGAVNGPYAAAFGPKDIHERSATNIDAAVDTTSAAAPVHSVINIEKDATLEIAIEVVREQPVAAL
jgi:carboxyl-terminal processing protease